MRLKRLNIVYSNILRLMNVLFKFAIINAMQNIFFSFSRLPLYMDAKICRVSQSI